MRASAVLALSVLVIAGGALEAQARGARLHLAALPRIGSATPAPAAKNRTAEAAPTTEPAPALRGVEPTEAQVPPPPVPPPATTGSVPEKPPVGKPAEPAKPAKPAEPWCRSGRTTGNGSGFCIVN